MAIPATVTLDRSGISSLDLTPLVASNSLTWSSVVPGGFASSSFTLDGDPRQLVKQIPYLSILRVIGDSGKVLFEGQIEDLAPFFNDSGAGVKVGAFGLQNKLSEVTARTIWSKRDLDLVQRSVTLSTPEPAFDLTIGNYDPADLTKSGFAVAGNGGTSSSGVKFQDVMYTTPVGVTFNAVVFTYDKAGSANLIFQVYYAPDASTYTKVLDSNANVTNSAQALATPGANNVLFREITNANIVTAITDFIKVRDIRVLGQITSEDVFGGFYGGTLIRSLLSYINGFNVPNFLQAGIIEAGTDFTVDHLDASVRRSVLDLLREVAQYYSREWAVWEDAKLDWKTPNLSQHQWMVSISDLSSMDLDASVVNSAQYKVVMYTDAASGFPAEAIASSTDRRNPYVLTQQSKSDLISPGFPMTATTAQQFANLLLQDLGFGPVPAAGRITIPGEKIIQHAQGNAVKAWEIRAGDNLTISDLPLADIFTQDGRGEILFHIVSADADSSSGLVTLSLDSYGSKRSDVLLARLAEATKLLTG